MNMEKTVWNIRAREKKQEEGKQMTALYIWVETEFILLRCNIIMTTKENDTQLQYEKARGGLSSWSVL